MEILPVLTSSGDRIDVAAAQTDTIPDLLKTLEEKVARVESMGLWLNHLPLKELAGGTVLEWTAALREEGFDPVLYAFLPTAAGGSKELLERSYLLVTKERGNLQMLKIDPVLLGVETVVKLASPRFGFIRADHGSKKKTALVLCFKTDLVPAAEEGEEPDPVDVAITLTVKANGRFEAEVRRAPDTDEEEAEADGSSNGNNSSQGDGVERLSPTVEVVELKDVEGLKREGKLRRILDKYGPTVALSSLGCLGQGLWRVIFG